METKTGADCDLGLNGGKRLGGILGVLGGAYHQVLAVLGRRCGPLVEQLRTVKAHVPPLLPPRRRAHRKGPRVVEVPPSLPDQVLSIFKLTCHQVLFRMSCWFWYVCAIVRLSFVVVMCLRKAYRRW